MSASSRWKKINMALLALVLATPVEAHCYERWYYPWPQGCKVVGLHGQERHGTREVARWPQAPSRRVARVTPTVGEQGLVPPSVAQLRRHEENYLSDDEPDIPLPSLARADVDGGAADEATRARVLLRAALELANGQ